MWDGLFCISPVLARDVIEDIEKLIPSFRGVKFSGSDLMDFGQCVSHSKPHWSLLYGMDEVSFSILTFCFGPSVLCCCCCMTCHGLVLHHWELKQKLSLCSSNSLQLWLWEVMGQLAGQCVNPALCMVLCLHLHSLLSRHVHVILYSFLCLQHIQLFRMSHQQAHFSLWEWRPHPSQEDTGTAHFTVVGPNFKKKYFASILFTDIWLHFLTFYEQFNLQELLSYAMKLGEWQMYHDIFFTKSYAR